MDDINDNNRTFEDELNTEEHNFKFNFINTPWDRRTHRSKIGIIALLSSIFLATLFCIIFHFVRYYDNKVVIEEVHCHLVKMGDNKFVARIHLISTRELLCLGAVLSKTSVLANGICVKSGPVRLRLGSITDPRCKKGFSVDVIEKIHHDGAIFKNLVVLTTFENFGDCGDVIPIGTKKIDLQSQVYIFSRPLRGDKTLARQPATPANSDYPISILYAKGLNRRSMICVKNLSRCPVRVGDLLIQGGVVYGIASTSIHRTDRSKTACFADLKLIIDKLKELEVN